MKKYTKLFIGFPLLAILIGTIPAFGQADAVIPSSNRSTTSLEKNLLFFADQRYSVTQAGSVSLPLGYLFDGSFGPVYSEPLNEADPYIILIENLPNLHTQAGAWFGWTTRYWQPTKFKLEVYNIYGNANTWITVADVQSYSDGSYIAQLPHISVGKIKLTIYRGAGPDNRFGLSELYFIHPEATAAYDHLMVQYNSSGDVGIGTATPGEKLSVNGKIRAHEIKVETDNWPDYVFEAEYKITSLSDLERYIKANKHLPDMPSADEVESNGLALGEIVKQQQKKIEELTLHQIELNKRLDVLLLKLDEQNIVSGTSISVKP